MRRNYQIHTQIKPAAGLQLLNLKEIWKYKDLLLMFAQRDLKLRYRQTFMGVAWVILQPLVTAVIFMLIFGVLADLPSGELDYLLFAFTGTISWNLFAQTLARAGSSLVSNSSIITKVYFPRILLPIASSLSVLVDFFVGFSVLLVLMVFYKVQLQINFLLFPVFLFLAVCISLGVSFWISALSVYYRDFVHVLPFLIQAWMYASPVAYSSILIPELWRDIYSLNPMVGVIEGFRWAVVGGENFTVTSLYLSILMSFLVFLSGIIVFKRIENSFADVI